MLIDMIPSINSLIVTGLLIIAIFFIFIKNIKSVIKLNYYQLLMLLSIITIAIGIHGLLHSSTEVNYNFNPYKYLTSKSKG